MPTLHYADLPSAIQRKVLENIDTPPACACWDWAGNYNRDLPVLRWKGKSGNAIRLVNECFKHRSIDSTKIARHTCTNRWCVNPGHTYFVERKEITPVMRGENHPNAKLTRTDVAVIRRRGKHSKAEDLSAEFGVTPEEISHILNRKRWKHL